MKQIRVYNQVFRIEKTVYSVQGINLPLPVSYRQMAFFVGTLLVMVFLNKFPPISWIDYFLIKFVAIPVIVAWFFTRKTLDGKAPHRFILRYLEHLFKAHHFARYQELEKPRDNCYKYTGEVTYRLTSGGDSK
ncbi:TcpE family conjugal transfer membrane protein [Paenactinomyces guangxiensis]|uniref:Conjugal transfer protein n=1 Tax=Paenactinomyces guangxiensis TaxID=1490290 RepID=A0A7W2A801_9BACL|nr:TcpE family conjugal transfer membrane protein [Paenactinomyces guangxiensis]MBA4493652.1 conjugal transfer protein [Paenactinomyces guangxiensis]MBH8590939.1 conjugal transfer protein [Paenactinomyces guangxiensis]